MSLTTYDRPTIFSGDVYITPNTSDPAQFGNGDLQVAGTIYTDAVVENTTDNGVVIEDLNITDNQITYAIAAGGSTTYLTHYSATYTTATDIDYAGTPSEIDITDLSLTLPAGTYLCGYDFCLESYGHETYPVAVYVHNSGGSRIQESKTLVKRYGNSGSDRVPISKTFKMVVASEDTFQVAIYRDFDPNTSVAISMTGSTSHSGTADQFPSFWAILDEASRISYSEYTGAPSWTDIQKDGTNYVDITDLELTLSPGTYLMSYNVSPSVNVPVMNLAVRDSSNNVVFESKEICYISNNIPTSRPISKNFIHTVETTTTFKVSIKEESGSNTNTLIDMSTISGISNPDQVPSFLAFNLSDLTYDYVNYSGASTVNYSGTTPIDFPSLELTLPVGTYMIGYSIQIHTWASLGNIYVRDGSNPEIDASRTMCSMGVGQAQQPVNKIFFYEVTSPTTLKVSANLDTSATVAARDSTFDNPVFWAIKLVAPATTDQGVLIENIRITDNYIAFENSEDAPTNNANHSLIFRSSGNTYGNVGDLYLETHNGTSNAVHCIAPFTKIVQYSNTTTSVSYNGTNYVDLGNITIDNGTWMIFYTLSCEATSPTGYFRVYDGNAGSYITLSRCATADTIRHNLAHSFIYTNTGGSNTLTLRARLDSGTGTGFIVRPSLSGNIGPDPDLVLLFQAIRID